MSPPWKLEVSLHESPANANRLHFGWVGRWSTFNVYRKSSKFCWTHGTVEKLILQFYIPPSFGGQGQYVVYITAQSTSLRAETVDGVRPGSPPNTTAAILLFPDRTRYPIHGMILATWSEDAEVSECYNITNVSTTPSGSCHIQPFPRWAPGYQAGCWGWG